jgi:hypothetical protein
MSACILCGHKAILTKPESTGRVIYKCDICGVFAVSDLVQDEVHKHKSKIRAFLRHREIIGKNDTVLITFQKAKLDKTYLQVSVEQIISHFPESLNEQIEMSLYNLILLSRYPGYEVKIDKSAGPTFYLLDDNPMALAYIINAIAEKGLIEIPGNKTTIPCNIVVSPKGWVCVARHNSQKGARRHLLLIYNRGAESAGIVEQATENIAQKLNMHLSSSSMFAKESCAIGSELETKIRVCDIIFADLTGQAPEAYFAAGFARALYKRILVTCHEKDRKKIKSNHLDIRFWNTEEELTSKYISFAAEEE